ncbi:MAG: V-type ATP synthase subunit E family protein [Gammaproteobacteria bacterium]|nr:V-type ATP synthase subunit E family protein [Gammaproteobacteria bacterium]
MKRPMDQVEALEKAILEHAEEMASETRKAAEVGRRDILRESSERLHLREEKETLLAKSLADRAYLRKVQADELKLQTVLDHMRWNLVQSVIERLTERMHELRQDPSNYLGLLRALLKQAAGQIDAERLLIFCNEEDRHQLESAWEDFTRGLPGDKTYLLAEIGIDTRGGLRVSTEDQRIQIDHTFEGRLERLQRKIHQVLVERLLPSPGNGGRV